MPPLLYTVTMNRRVCLQLAAGSWACGFLNSPFHSLLMSALSFCRLDDIIHFMSDVRPLLELSCTGTALNKAVLHAAIVFIGIRPCFFTVVSYICIIQASLQIYSTEGRHKAFSTCTSHLTILVMYYSMALFNYNQSRSGYSLGIDILVSTLYCILMAMLNPGLALGFLLPQAKKICGPGPNSAPSQPLPQIPGP
ncbi:unnamed protein product, partial [Natator depressus]